MGSLKVSATNPQDKRVNLLMPRQQEELKGNEISLSKVNRSQLNMTAIPVQSLKKSPSVCLGLALGENWKKSCGAWGIDASQVGASLSMFVFSQLLQGHSNLCFLSASIENTHVHLHASLLEIKKAVLAPTCRDPSKHQQIQQILLFRLGFLGNMQSGINSSFLQWEDLERFFLLHFVRRKDEIFQTNNVGDSWASPTFYIAAGGSTFCEFLEASQKQSGPFLRHDSLNCRSVLQEWMKQAGVRSQALLLQLPVSFRHTLMLPHGESRIRNRSLNPNEMPSTRG